MMTGAPATLQLCSLFKGSGITTQAIGPIQSLSGPRQSGSGIRMFTVAERGMNIGQ
jgi:hypothetical protein